jgi:single-strand DNA-binding protein
MSYVNKVILVGNLGQNPEIKKFDNGGKVAMFSLATSKSYKQDNGEYKTITQWHRIVVRNKNLIEHIIEKGYIKKGLKVYLEGELTTREFQDKESSITMRITEVIVNMGHQIQILTPQEKSGGKHIDESANETIDDDIPF